MNKERFAWITAAKLINAQHSEPIVDDEDHEDDETIQPVYDALVAFAEQYARLAMVPRFKKGEKVIHTHAKEVGTVLDTRDDPQGYNYLINFPTRKDWFKAEVLG